MSCDRYMKWQLLTMIEWNTLAGRGWDTDVWFNGRYSEERVKPETRKAPQGAFGHYDYGDVEKALFATADLFLKLARETGQRLGYENVAPKAGNSVRAGKIMPVPQ